MNGKDATAAQLLREAATCINRALLQLDDQEVPCKCCERALFRDLDQHRIAEQFEETPRKLHEAADRLDHAGPLRKSSHGYSESLAAHVIVTKESS